MRGLVWLPIFSVLACSPNVDVKENGKPPDVATPAAWKQPDNATMEQLAAKDPVAFLENCVHRYNQDVHSYRLKFCKKERINEKLNDAELIDVCFREKPHSVLFRWIEG